mmetsp:Transcript_29897/g.82086  ORF Transcript_29897/g.82086 Transcript_29897/m.82086 type:complete len:125 (+) Transcript_29897:146-520(+)
MGLLRFGFRGYGAAPLFILTSSRTANFRGRKKSAQCPKTSAAAAAEAAAASNAAATASAGQIAVALADAPQPGVHLDAHAGVAAVGAKMRKPVGATTYHRRNATHASALEEEARHTERSGSAMC